MTKKLSVRGTQRSASYLLPDPGGEVVRSFLDEIESLERQRDALLELTAFAYDNLNDMPISDEWAQKWCQKYAAIKSVEETK